MWFYYKRTKYKAFFVACPFRQKPQYIQIDFITCCRDPSFIVKFSDGTSLTDETDSTETESPPSQTVPDSDENSAANAKSDLSHGSKITCLQ